MNPLRPTDTELRRVIRCEHGNLFECDECVPTDDRQALIFLAGKKAIPAVVTLVDSVPQEEWYKYRIYVEQIIP